MKFKALLRDPQEGASRQFRMLASAALIAGVVTGYFLRPLLHRLRFRFFENGGAISDGEWEEDGELLGFEDCKLVFCVRTDLKMQKGKIAAQVGHATLGAYKKALRLNPALLRHWEVSAQPKIALQIRSAAEADRLERNARQKGIPTYKVFDAGKTQIAAGSMTVLAIGPGPVSKINEVTGHLKLL